MCKKVKKTADAPPRTGEGVQPGGGCTSSLHKAVHVESRSRDRAGGEHTIRSGGSSWALLKVNKQRNENPSSKQCAQQALTLEDGSVPASPA